SPAPQHMHLYHDPDDLPYDLKDQMISTAEIRSEFYGDQGRHYHIARLPEKVILVAEVKDKLIIRPLRKTILTTYSVMMVLLTMVGCFVAHYLARRTLKPLISLAEMVQYANPEKLPEKFARNYPSNEIGVLAAILEKSLERIRCFINREQKFNRDVSHDLRTPITVVSGAVEVLQKRYQLSPDTAALIHRIEVANKHMERTVETLLSLAHENNTAQLKEKIKALPIVENTILQLGHLLQNKPVEICIQGNTSSKLSVQAGVLEILLSNLLGNAFEYTESGYVSIEIKNNQLIISDTAGGMDESMRDTMFTEYSKGRDSSGFGIGLSIVKRICEHHKIDIIVEHNGKGTRIILDFNCSALPAK
ncbi:MAG: HAMP domain-containing histidine kinase, partial [Gammaproteobacteria bacterium]|nr:HAMP domain-containing histidine kinase [Gammaproteobacteria bacterium]